MYDETKLKRQIENAINNTKSMASAARSLGVNYKTFKKYADKFGVFKPNQSGKGIYQICLEEVFLNKVPMKSSVLKHRLFDEGIMEEKCQGEDCGITEWKGKKITLELDHIDGDRNNNSKDNLRILCPNCHSQTPTFRRGQNKPYVSDDEIKSAFAKVNNITQLCSRLGLVDGGGNLKHMRKRLAKLGLKFENVEFPEEKNKSKKKKEVVKCKCKSCGKDVNRRSERCVKCSQEARRKVKRPPYQILKAEVEENGYTDVGRKYGVSDNAIRKWLKTN